jgi:hypothetical protein
LTTEVNAPAVEPFLDSRTPGGEGGFGTATLAFAVDENGDAVAYGWYGEGQDPQTFVRTHMLFGRVLR